MYAYNIMTQSTIVPFGIDNIVIYSYYSSMLERICELRRYQRYCKLQYPSAYQHWWNTLGNHHFFLYRFETHEDFPTKSEKWKNFGNESKNVSNSQETAKNVGFDVNWGLLYRPVTRMNSNSNQIVEVSECTTTYTRNIVTHFEFQQWLYDIILCGSNAVNIECMLVQ